MIGKLYASNFGRLIYPIFKIFKPTKVKTKEGFTMHIHKGRDYISDCILLKKEWEGKKSELFKELIKPTDIVVDVGANIGYFSLLFSKLSAEVYSFEPQWANFKLLKENLEINNAENVLPLQFAVSDKDEEVTLNYGKQTYGGSSIIGKDRGFGSEQVEALTLDDCFKGVPVDVLKIDVEGAEFKVLKGAIETLKNVRVIVTEFIPHNSEDPEGFVRFLLYEGFTLFDINEEDMILKQFDINDFKKMWKGNKNLFKDILCTRGIEYGN